MKLYIKAYYADDTQCLGNLDGQGIIRASQYKRTNQYKALSTFKTLNNRIKYYLIVDERERTIEKVNNLHWKEEV